MLFRRSPILEDLNVLPPVLWGHGTIRPTAKNPDPERRRCMGIHQWHLPDPTLDRLGLESEARNSSMESTDSTNTGRKESRLERGMQ